MTVGVQYGDLDLEEALLISPTGTNRFTYKCSHN